MKKIFVLCWIVMWTMSCAWAETPREVLLERITVAYLQHTVLPADSPMLDMFLDGAKARNPQTSEETWRVVKAKLAVALSKRLSQKGGALDLATRQAMTSLSDAELQHLLEILSDPVFVKYQEGMYKPETQKQMLQGFANDGFAMLAVTNEILRQHGLNETH